VTTVNIKDIDVHNTALSYKTQVQSTRSTDTEWKPQRHWCERKRCVICAEHMAGLGTREQCGRRTWPVDWMGIPLDGTHLISVSVSY